MTVKSKKTRIRVAFPFVGDSVGGSHRSVIELYYGLLGKNIEPFFVLHDRTGPLEELLRSLDINYYYLKIPKLAGESPALSDIAFSLLRSSIYIVRFLKKHSIDLVHGNDLRVNLTWSVPTRLLGRKYIWHQRSLMSSSILWKASLLLANHFVTISDYVSQSLPNNIPKSKKSLVLNPFNTKEFYDKYSSRRLINDLYGVPKKSILIGYIGRIVEWKNLDFLIESFIKYENKSDLHLHLIIVGTGVNEYADTVKQLAYKLGSTNTITFAGFSLNPSRVLSSLDLMIAPSSAEPFGRTLVESMIQKTPVLAARGGGHSEIITHGVTGRLYEHNNIGSFTKQLGICLTDNRSMHKMISNASINATSKYCSHKHTESIVQVYKDQYINKI
jgi:glycosyltransferase involved in cell wall biosynthesis